MAGLSGTGRLGDDLYLLAHHELSGRPHLQPRALGVGLAAGLLGELLLAGCIGVLGGGIGVTGRIPPPDAVARSVLAQVAGEPGQPPVLVIVAETAGGLLHPAGGHLSVAALAPTALAKAGFGAFGVLAVIAVLGFVGFEQAPVLGEEAKNSRRTVPVATYTALGMIAVIYAAASWAMAAHTGTTHIAEMAGKQGPGLLFGLAGSTGLGDAAQLLFITSLFAAALSFHNATWRYAFALGRENVLPAALGRTGANNIPKAASLAQSVTALAVIVLYAVTGQNPMVNLFFWLGTTGGYGILLLLTATSVAIVVFFARNPLGENIWRRLIAPALAAVLLGGIVVLATRNYATLLGVAPSSPAAWALPGSFLVAAVVGEVWAIVLKDRRPHVYEAIGLGPHAITTQLALPPEGTRR